MFRLSSDDINMLLDTWLPALLYIHPQSFTCSKKFDKSYLILWALTCPPRIGWAQPYWKIFFTKLYHHSLLRYSSSQIGWKWSHEWNHPLRKAFSRVAFIPLKIYSKGSGPGISEWWNLILILVALIPLQLKFLLLKRRVIHWAKVEFGRLIPQ